MISRTSQKTPPSISSDFTNPYANYGRYQVVHKLGRGGLSTVRLARDLQLGNDVALKILSSSKNTAEEVEIHENIRKTAEDFSRLVLSQNHFCLTRVDKAGKERTHRVLVLPVRGSRPLTAQLGHIQNRS